MLTPATRIVEQNLDKLQYQEEYAGAPVQCLIPGTNQWALVGVSSWRIACAASGIERPRMYDKITSNAAWIRET
ncbi:hypothetical protein DOY81_009574, partial [Sarcophaga bullata]